MAHLQQEIDLPLSKVYEHLSNPVNFPKFLTDLEEVVKVNSKTFDYRTTVGEQEYTWTTNVIDNLRNTRFAWITINGNLNQTGTIRFTPLDNGTRTRVDMSLDYRTFFGAAEASLQTFIDELPTRLAKHMASFKQLVESDSFKDAEESLVAENEVTA